uniref:Uncharacterized protein n=1 Tax=Wuchereria bancrofti TaxID=6293 RepID=A0A1I8EMA2_WUCBA
MQEGWDEKAEEMEEGLVPQELKFKRNVEEVGIFSIWYLRQAVRDAKRVAHSRLENAPVTSFGIPRPAKLPLPVPVLHPPSRGRDIGVTGLKKRKRNREVEGQERNKIFGNAKGRVEFFSKHLEQSTGRLSGKDSTIRGRASDELYEAG